MGSEKDSDVSATALASPAADGEISSAVSGQIWANSTSAAGLALALGIKIKMWEGMNRMWLVFGEDNSKQTILLYNPHNVHYEGLIPIVQ